MVEEFRYKPWCCGFDSRWGHGGVVINIIVPAAVLALASTQLVTDRSTVDTYCRVKAADE